MEFMLALLLHGIVSARGFESRLNVESEKPPVVERKGSGVGAQELTAPGFTLTELNGPLNCLSTLRGKLMLINPLGQFAPGLC